MSLSYQRCVNAISAQWTRVDEGLGGLLPADVDAVIRQLESCGDCQNCMDVCPICSVDRPERTRMVIISDRASCAGWFPVRVVVCVSNPAPITSPYQPYLPTFDNSWLKNGNMSLADR